MKKFWSIIKDLLSNTFKFTYTKKNIRESQIGIINEHVNIQNGSLIQNSAAVELKTKAATDEFVNQIVAVLKENNFVDVNNDKFKYYINQSLLILKLNDSPSKRVILKELLLRKFSGAECGIDDSDFPTTVALEAMRHLSDMSIKHLCAFRLLINVIPSIIKAGSNNDLSIIMKFIDNAGMMNEAEIMNLRRLGLLHDLDNAVYSLEEIINHLDVDDFIAAIKNFENSLALSFSLSPAGVELTDISMQYLLGLKGEYDCWLPMINKSLHLKDLIVDEDVMVKKNVVAYGTVAAKGAYK